ncbi:MFS general substrate transporter [Polyplosphaeria fusca]|uniref:MFS general substrate transporter n=1 Tax=Polyplosphaeria fusca TaxID=682080 RepID=A0A9P4QP02_9PLEO|nr:MFS general substrate transporter [Polyplosphaeria fusca]
MLNLVVAWDATAVSIALPSIATAVRGSALASFWLSTGFLAAATIFIQPFSVLSDIFGRKALLLAALTLFTIGAFVTAVSRVIAGLLIGRVIQGIGAGGIYALSSVIMTDLVSEVDRRNWNAIFGAIWALIAIVGPIIAGSLAQNGQWRWIFWINLPFCGLAFLIIPVFAQLKPALPGAKIPKLRSVDWFGHVLFGASLISILLGITWGGILHTWSSPATIASIVIGSVGFSMLFLWSWLSPFAPFVNIRPFLNITNLSVYLSAFLQGIVTFSALYFLPLYFQIAKPNISLAAVGTWLLPCSVALGLFALITFLFISIWTIWRPAVWVGWALLMVGVPSMALFTRTTENGIWIGITIMAGIGAGILFPSLAVALEVVTGSPSDVRQAREAVTNFTFVQTLGRTLGVAVSGTIFQNGVLNQLLDNRTLARSAERIAQNAVAHITVIHGWADGALRTGTQDAFIDSIRTIWIAMAAFAAVAFIGSLFMRSNPTKRRPATETNGLGQV